MISPTLSINWAPNRQAPSGATTTSCGCSLEIGLDSNGEPFAAYFMCNGHTAAYAVAVYNEGQKEPNEEEEEYGDR